MNWKSFWAGIGLLLLLAGAVVAAIAIVMILFKSPRYWLMVQVWSLGVATAGAALLILNSTRK